MITAATLRFRKRLDWAHRRLRLTLSGGFVNVRGVISSLSVII